MYELLETLYENYCTVPDIQSCERRCDGLCCDQSSDYRYKTVYSEVEKTIRSFPSLGKKIGDEKMTGCYYYNHIADCMIGGERCEKRNCRSIFTTISKN